MSKLEDMLKGRIPYSRTNINEVMLESSNNFTKTKPEDIINDWYKGILDAGTYIAPFKPSVKFPSITKETGYDEYWKKMNEFIAEDGSVIKLEFAYVDNKLYWMNGEQFIPQDGNK